MFFFPKDRPVIQSLNSYYLNTERLLEHFQGEISSGCIHFKSPAIEAIVYFDEDNLFSGILKEKDKLTVGKDAISGIINATLDNNFSVSIFEIAFDMVFFWANLPVAEVLHKDLSSEFTDLDALLAKMKTEKLIGYIDVAIGNGNEGGFIFFSNGFIIGQASYIDAGRTIDELLTENDPVDLITKTRENGGIFNVFQIPAHQDFKVELEEVADLSIGPEPVEEESPKQINPEFIIEMVRQLLLTFEKAVLSDKRIKADFDTLLRRKFIEKADKYTFLDPFAAEFQYTNGKIVFYGEANINVLKGVVESVREIAVELKMHKKINTLLLPWLTKYASEVKAYELFF